MQQQQALGVYPSAVSYLALEHRGRGVPMTRIHVAALRP